jgi:hypothetical protein
MEWAMMSDYEIMKWFLFGLLAGVAIASIFWKAWIDDHV